MSFDDTVWASLVQFLNTNVNIKKKQGNNTSDVLVFLVTFLYFIEMLFFGNHPFMNFKVAEL